LRSCGIRAAFRIVSVTFSNSSDAVAMVRTLSQRHACAVTDILETLQVGGTYGAYEPNHPLSPSR